MLKKTIYLIAPALIIGAAGLTIGQVNAEDNRVTFPTNLDELVHYTGRQRGNNVTFIKTTQEIMDLVKAGQPVPPGSQFVLVGYRENVLVRYFVMEKGEGWGQDYDEYRRTGDWQFQHFRADGTVNTEENTARCQSCHQGARNSDYLFTTSEIEAYHGTPVN